MSMKARKSRKTPAELLEKRNKTASITFRLDAERDAQLRAFAEEHGVGHSTLARRIIEEYLDDVSGER